MREGEREREEGGGEVGGSNLFELGVRWNYSLKFVLMG